MKQPDADREARLAALRDFSADQRMRNHEMPLSASKAEKSQDCGCADDAHYLRSHQQ